MVCVLDFKRDVGLWHGILCVSINISYRLATFVSNLKHLSILKKYSLTDVQNIQIFLDCIRLHICIIFTYDIQFSQKKTQVINIYFF
jgi:hypothetical protein